MSKTITVIPGDGIGPEVTAATLSVLQEAGAHLEYDRQLGGMSAVEAVRDPLPKETLDSIRRTGIALKGPLTTPLGSGFRSINVAIRKEFELYANVRPVITLVPGQRYEDIDLVLIRENTEGLYVGVEHYIGLEGDPRAAAESVMIITRFGAERIVRYAFEYARSKGRKKVTLAHKANILKFTQGLFLEAGETVASAYDDIEFESRIIDATAMQLVKDPYSFDVLVMENMFGDILSDLMAGLVGGLGVAPAANIGSEASMFEAVHGSAPDIAGQGVANPSALILASALMLDQVDQTDVANRVRAALQTTLSRPESRTVDMGGSANTEQFVKTVIQNLE